MKIHLYLLLVSLFLKSAGILAQTDPIQLDRPDQTECPFIVPKGYIQAENGFNFETNEIKQHICIAPTILWKLGLSKKLETRFITTHYISNFNNIITKAFEPIKIGFKYNFFAEKGILPITSIIVHCSIPKSKIDRSKIKNYSPDLRFTMLHNLSKKQTLGYNLGIEYDYENNTKTSIYTLTTGYVLSDKIGSYIEIFGNGLFSKNQSHQIDGGITYLINNNLIADVSAGLGINKNLPKNYVSLGFSYRFRLLKTAN